MINKKLPRNFYLKPTLDVANNLLGKFLIRKKGKKLFCGMIVETEAYIGDKDKACHASKGKTKRTRVMFMKGGTAYIYMIYGMYHCFNVVTEKPEYPAAVLVRGVDIGIISKNNLSFAIRAMEGKRKSRTTKRDFLLTNGPGKLCRYFGIDRDLNEEDLVTSNKLWIEDRGVKISDKEIVAAKRIGVDYAGECAGWKWRFYVKNNKYISKK